MRRLRHRNASDSLRIGSSYGWPARCGGFPGPQGPGLSDRLVKLLFTEIRIGGVTISLAQTVTRDPLAAGRDDKIPQIPDFISTIVPDPDTKPSRVG